LRVWEISRSIDGTTLGDFFLSKNESLATLDGAQSSSLAGTAFKLQSNLLGGLGLLPENGFSLTAVSSLLGIISSLSLDDQRVLALLVLGHFVDLVLFAFGAVGSLLLGCVDLLNTSDTKHLLTISSLTILILNTYSF
jgi:hypothetical protein